MQKLKRYHFTKFNLAYKSSWCPCPQAAADELPFICPVATCLPVRDAPTTIHCPVGVFWVSCNMWTNRTNIFISSSSCRRPKNSSGRQIKFLPFCNMFMDKQFLCITVLFGNGNRPTDIQWDPALIRMASSSSSSTFVSICCRNRVEVSRELLSKLKA